ncbi:MAG: hypothetical protein PHP31_02095 [Lentimicrobiaceae bacterium]|nr:hypothetical protein [Lentimicrobiaceae bacterium]
MISNDTWQGKTQISKISYNLSLFFIRNFGVIPGYAIGLVLVPFFLIIHHRETKNTFRYFRRNQQFGVLKSTFSVVKNHILFAFVIADKFAVLSGYKKGFSLKTVDQHIFDDVANNKNSSGLLVQSHVGNSEIVAFFLKSENKIIHSLVYGFEAKHIQKHRTELLAKQNTKLIPVVDPYSHFISIYQAVDNRDLMGVSGDRTYEGSTNIECEFLNNKALFPLNPFQIATKLNLPVIVLFTIRKGYKKYTTYIYRIEVDGDNLPLKEKSVLLLKEYVKTLETVVKKYPLQWFNYYDFWNYRKH